VWNEFTADRKADFQLTLNKNQRAFKERLFKIHVTQEKYFAKLLGGSSKGNVLGREVLRFVHGPIDYYTPPTDPVGYDFPGSPVKFKDFVNYLQAVDDTHSR